MTAYLDNAATSFPKPDTVYQAVSDVLQNIGGSSGRAGHRWSQEASRIISNVRKTIATFFGIQTQSNIVFTKNGTEALNLGIKGLLKQGDHVITTSMEHNSVLRPLRSLADKDIETTVVRCSKEGYLDPDDMKKAIKANTQLIVMTHASNVTGTLLPIEEVGRIAKAENIVFMVDAAQSAGVINIDVEKQGIDLLACPGHKALLGPQGTGFLYVRDGIELHPLLEGGTGWNSEDETQPESMPEKFESGTLNTLGLNGLRAGVNFIETQGIERIREHEKDLIHELTRRLSTFEEIIFYGPSDSKKKTGILSFNIKNVNPEEVGFILDSVYNTLVRVGLHCAPEAHKTIGTFPEGSVRVSPGYFNRADEIDILCEAVREIIGRL